jgi:hypothetical protein
MRRTRTLLVAVSFDVLLCSLGGVMRRVGMVALSNVGVVRRRFVVSIFMMLGCLTVVVGGHLMVLCGLGMMMRCFLRHGVFLSRGKCRT